MEELVPYIREAVDKKQENMRRRRRRDALRLQLVRVLKLIAENRTFGESSSVLERDTLHPTFVGEEQIKPFLFAYSMRNDIFRLHGRSKILSRN